MDAELDVNPSGLVGVVFKIIPAAFLVVVCAYVESIIMDWIAVSPGVSFAPTMHITWMHYLLAFGLASALAGQAISYLFDEPPAYLTKMLFLLAAIAPIVALGIQCFELFWPISSTQWGAGDYLDAVGFFVPIVIGVYLTLQVLSKFQEAPFAMSILLCGVCLGAFPLTVVLVVVIGVYVAIAGSIIICVFAIIACFSGMRP